MRSNIDKWVKIPIFFKTKLEITFLQQTQSFLPENSLNKGEAHTVTEFHLLQFNLTGRSATQFC